MSAPAVGVTVVRGRRWLGGLVALAVIAVAVTAGIVVGRSTAPVAESLQISFETKTFEPLCGNEPSRPFRCYEQDLVGGLPKPLTPEGFDVGPIAPDGRTIVVIDADRKKQLFSLDAGATRPRRPHGRYRHQPRG